MQMNPPHRVSYHHCHVADDRLLENKQEGYILAKRGVTLASYGENVAIFIESVNGVTKTRAEVISKKAMATNIFASDAAS